MTSDSAIQKAMDLLRKFEGYISTPEWDVNAYRAGYGSDTVTYSDGSIHMIKKGMVISRDDAERDLQRRTVEFANHAESQVGTQYWAPLPDDAKAALISVTYNYGSLPGSVVVAIKHELLNEIANSIEKLRNANNGVNYQRRMKEAYIIRYSK